MTRSTGRYTALLTHDHSQMAHTVSNKLFIKFSNNEYITMSVVVHVTCNFTMQSVLLFEKKNLVFAPVFAVFVSLAVANDYEC